MATIKVKVIDSHTIQYPDGTVVERSSHPVEGPEDENLAWHAALGRFVDKDLLDETFETTVEE